MARTIAAMDNANIPAPILERTARTWEVELLISGVAVFAMLQLPGLLDDALFALEPRVSDDWRMLVILSYIYTKSAAVVLAFTFVLHLLFRAMWIALVGIHSVYPEGVRLDKIKMGPIQAGVERSRDNSIETAIERADNRASITFAIGVMIASLFVVICLGFCGGLLVLNLLASALDLDLKPMVSFFVFLGLFALVFLPYLCAFALDRAYGARLAPGSIAHRTIESIFEWSGRMGMGINNNTIMSVLTTNDHKRRMLMIIHGIMLLSLCGVGASFVVMSKPGLVGNYGLFPDDVSLRISSGSYDDLRDPARDGNAPYVQSMVVGGPYLKLVVPYDPRRNNAAMRDCKQPAADDRRRAEALLACLGKLHSLQLDGKVISLPDYQAASDPRSDRPALLAMIDIRDLPRGRHELHVARPIGEGGKWKRTPDPGYQRIVFWN